MIKADKTTSYDSGKIISLDEAAQKIAELKKKNMKAGLSCGGFDLLHPGHIKHFESARKLCDCLFVAVTSDKHVADRKGDGRPIFSEKLRAYSIASLQFVDYVIISETERATPVIKKLKPDYYIKGPDYMNKTTPGITEEAKVTESLGGKLMCTTDQKVSTTEIIRYIQEKLKRKKILLGIDRDGTLIENDSFFGKDKNWESQLRLKNEVANLLSFAQAKYDTTKIVISNQQGVARGYFDNETVNRINQKIGQLLKEKKLTVESWQFCPDVDMDYAQITEAEFLPEFVKEKTARKPSPEMLLKALDELKMKIQDFEIIIILGNSADDANLAKKLNSIYIDVRNKNYEELKSQFERSLT